LKKKNTNPPATPVAAQPVRLNQTVPAIPLGKRDGSRVIPGWGYCYFTTNTGFGLVQKSGEIARLRVGNG
jgi:hypothetical protein